LLAILRFVDLPNPDLFERYARHLADAILVIDDQNLEDRCAGICITPDECLPQPREGVLSLRRGCGAGI
jgi:hypothetical protein